MVPLGSQLLSGFFLSFATKHKSFLDPRPAHRAIISGESSAVIER